MPRSGDGQLADSLAPCTTATSSASRRRHAASRRSATVVAELGMVVEDRSSGFCGDIVKISTAAVTLRGRTNEHRHFRWKDGGFLLEGRPVTLVRPEPPKPAGPKLTASGSIATVAAAARVARASRIWVEGRHDAELLEHVWGADLPRPRDRRRTAARDRRPARCGRRLRPVADPPAGGARRPPRLRLEGGPPGGDRRPPERADHRAPVRRRVGRDQTEGARAGGLAGGSRGQPWKEGLSAALGVPLEGFWPKLRNRVQTYADLRPELVGAVERLIDFVGTDPTG